MDINQKKELLHRKALNLAKSEITQTYEQLEAITIWSYQNDVTLSKLSSQYDASKMQEYCKISLV